MRPGGAPYVAVVGRGGVLQGERRSLLAGAVLVVGRSRSCDLSLRRTRAFRTAERPAELLGAEPMRRVSRVHCEIGYLPDGRIEIRDLSQNGTYVDGRRIDRSHVVEPGAAPVTVVLADVENGALEVGFGSD